MDKRLDGRIGIITGASSGLGKATAIRFANSGARIVCADLRSSGTEEEINKQHGKDRAIFIKCDVTKEDDIADMVKKAAEWGGRVDIICNFAGILSIELLTRLNADGMCEESPLRLDNRCKLEHMNVRLRTLTGRTLSISGVYGYVASTLYAR